METLAAFFKRSTGRSKAGPAEEEALAKNPVNELQILEKHTDIVRCLALLQPPLLASAGDDGAFFYFSREFPT
jgi:hypothetical protein